MTYYKLNEEKLEMQDIYGIWKIRIEVLIENGILEEVQEEEVGEDIYFKIKDPQSIGLKAELESWVGVQCTHEKSRGSMQIQCKNCQDPKPFLDGQKPSEFIQKRFNTMKGTSGSKSRDIIVCIDLLVEELKKNGTIK